MLISHVDDCAYVSIISSKKSLTQISEISLHFISIFLYLKVACSIPGLSVEYL
jgi:hypothetical protein